MGQTRQISFDVLAPILIASCGAKRLPTYQCNLQFNMIAAKALGLTVRDSFLLLADEMIE
jgi:hypothetical protein